MTERLIQLPDRLHSRRSHLVESHETADACALCNGPAWSVADAGREHARGDVVGVEGSVGEAGGRAAAEAVRAPYQQRPRRRRPPPRQVRPPVPRRRRSLPCSPQQRADTASAALRRCNIRSACRRSPAGVEPPCRHTVTLRRAVLLVLVQQKEQLCFSGNSQAQCDSRDAIRIDMGRLAG